MCNAVHDMEIKNEDSHLSFSEVAVSACLHACVQTRALCFTYATCKFHICIFFRSLSC